MTRVSQIIDDCSARLFAHTHYEVHPYSRLMTDTFFYLSQDVCPTQAAPEDDENAGLLRRVGGLFGLGKSNVKRKRGDSDDDDDNAIATSSKKKPKTAAKGGTGKTPGSPQPLGVANRHSKRAVTFANVGALPRKKKVYWTSGETRALEVGVRTLMDTNQFELGNTYDKQTNTLNDKWRKIYEQHKDVFDVNGRTTMDLKDKWRNILKARGGGAGDGAGGAGQGGAAGGGGNVAAAGGTGASPAATTDKSTSWGRALATRLGLARTPSVGGGTGGSTPGGTVTVVPLKRSSTAAPTVPRSPGISNRHSEYRKKLGLSNGVRKKAAKWGADEVAALAAGVAADTNAAVGRDREGKGLSHPPRSASAIAHTRTRRDYYDQKGAFPRTVTLTVYSYQSLIHITTD